MKGSDLLVAALENEGVEQIFGVPGEENLDVVESLRRSRIKLIVTRHEQAAAFMAATHGRLTGKPGVCLASGRLSPSLIISLNKVRRLLSKKEYPTNNMVFVFAHSKNVSNWPLRPLRNDISCSVLATRGGWT